MKTIYLFLFQQITNDSLVAEDDDSLIKLLIDLAENTPKFLRSQLTNIIEMCLKVIHL